MEFPPKMWTDLMPPDLKAYAAHLLLGSICVVAVIALLFLIVVFKLLFGGKKKAKGRLEDNLEEDLTTYPELTKKPGDVQLRCEGVPVRLRLVVIAPAGGQSEVDLDELPKVLDKIVPGLGDIYKHDKPRVREWPKQVSYQGFGTHFHRNTLTGVADEDASRWVMIAGRVKLGKFQVMVGLAMQTIKPNTIGRRTVDSDGWATILRVRVRE